MKSIDWQWLLGWSLSQHQTSHPLVIKVTHATVSERVNSNNLLTVLTVLHMSLNMEVLNVKVPVLNNISYYWVWCLCVKKVWGNRISENIIKYGDFLVTFNTQRTACSVPTFAVSIENTNKTLVRILIFNNLMMGVQPTPKCYVYQMCLT